MIEREFWSAIVFLILTGALLAVGCEHVCSYAAHHVHVRIGAP